VRGPTKRRACKRMAAALLLALLATGSPALAGDFHRDLATVNQALVNNPSQVPKEALDACRTTRDMAITLFKMGKHDRAERRLQSCMQLLKIGEYR